MDNNVIVIVEDPETLYAIERHALHADAMLYGRPQKTGPAAPFAMRYGMAVSRLQWEQHDPQFAAALPVLEVYSQKIAPTAAQPLSALMVHSNRIDDPDSEEIVRRWNFAQDLLQLFIVAPNITASIDFMAVTQEIPDLCGEDWQEWVHPARDHANTIQPFRQYFHPQLPWQWSQTYWASKWQLPYQLAEEAATDTVNRAFNANAMRGISGQTFPLGPFPAVQLELFQIEPTLGSITLIWSASPGAAGYRLYTNGVPASGFTTAQTVTLTGLTLGTAYTYAIVAVNGYGTDASSLSNVLMYEHGVSEVMAVYNLSSDNPGGEL